MYIDTHQHWLPPSVVEELSSGPDRDCLASVVMRQSLEASPELADLDARAEILRSTGGQAILSLSPPSVALVSPTRGRELIATSNDEFADAVRDRPEFAGFFLALPLPDVEASLAELGRMGDHPSVVGVMVQVSPGEWSLADPRFEVVFRRMAEKGLPLQLHPGYELANLDPVERQIGMSVGAVYSTTVSALQLMLAGVLDRIPELIVIIPHLGGTLPYLAQRLVDQLSPVGEANVWELLAQRCYLDTCSYHPPALRCALETVGEDRLLLGSDYPFRGPFMRAVDDIHQNMQPQDDITKILSQNYTGLFGGVG